MSDSETRTLSHQRQEGTDGASKPVYLTVEVAYRLDDEDSFRVSESMAILRGLNSKGGRACTLRSWARSKGPGLATDSRGVAETRHLNVFDEELPR